MTHGNFRLPPLPLERTFTFSVVALAALFALLKPISAIDLDIFLRMGAWMHAQGRLLEVEPFALAADGTWFQNGTWLAQVVLYGVHRWGGYPALQLLLALAVLATLAASTGHLVQRGGWKLAGPGTLFVLAFLLQNLAIRPQTFSLPLFALVYLLLDRYPDRSITPPLLFLTMAAWTNLHGAFPIAFALPAAFWLEQGLGLHFERLRVRLDQRFGPRLERLRVGLERRPRGRTEQRPGSLPGQQPGVDSAARAPRVRSPRRWWLLGATMAAATLVNPYGPAIYRYILENSALPAQRGLSEWLAPEPDTFLGGRFYLSLVLATGLAVWARRRLSLSDLLLLGIFALLAARSQRMIVWWGLVSAPVLVRWIAGRPLEGALEPGPDGPPSPGARRLHTTIGYGALAFWTLLAVAAFPGLHEPAPDARGDYANLDEHTPAEATTFLETRPGGRLFHRLEWGSYLAWRLWPKYRTFIDIRMWIFPDDLWQAYLSASRGEPGWEPLLDRFGITTLVLARETQGGLIRAASAAPGWQIVHQDPLAVVLERRSPPEPAASATAPPSPPEPAAGATAPPSPPEPATGATAPPSPPEPATGATAPPSPPEPAAGATAPPSPP